MEFIEAVEVGLNHLRNGQVEEAQAIRESLELTSNDSLTDKERAKYFEFLGDLSIARFEYEDAKDAYTFMIRYEERSGEPRGGIGNSWGKIGEALVGMGHYREALGCFERAVNMMEEGDMAPEFCATPAFQWAEAHMSLGQFAEATKVFRRTLKFIGSNGDARSTAFVSYRLASAANQMASLESLSAELDSLMTELEALGMDATEVRDAMQRFEPTDRPYFDIAKEAYETAIEKAQGLDRALELNARLDFGKFQRQTGHAEDGLDTLIATLQDLDSAEDVPEHIRIELFHELGHAFLEDGELTQAEPLLDAASEMKRARGISSTWTDLARARLAVKKAEAPKAVRICAEALDAVDPSQLVDAQRVAADILEEAGEATQAKALRAQADALSNQH